MSITAHNEKYRDFCVALLADILGCPIIQGKPHLSLMVNSEDQLLHDSSEALTNTHFDLWPMWISLSIRLHQEDCTANIKAPSKVDQAPYGPLLREIEKIVTKLTDRE